MGCSQMATTHKKGETLSPKQGRPITGALSTYPKELLQLLSKLRSSYPGWGATNLRIELIEEHGYALKDLPSIDSINRYLKEQGFIQARIPTGKISKGKCPTPVKKAHDQWELDAQGTIHIKGVGNVAMINTKDAKSKLHCMAFPTQTKGPQSQPKTIHYYWALRLAFEERGLPKAIQVDKDSVFLDSSSKSPFPSMIHLFLTGLGVELCFIDVPPPQKQAMVERSHQTMEKQVVQGQAYSDWQSLFRFTQKRRKRMNEKIPNRMLNNQPPLVNDPAAAHSGRFYQVEKEAQLIDMKRIFKFLAKCQWFRKVSSVKILSLDNKIYYVKTAKPGTQLQITFCNRSKKLIFRDDKELIVDKQPLKEFSKEIIMGGSSKDLIAAKKILLKSKDFTLLT